MGQSNEEKYSKQHLNVGQKFINDDFERLNQTEGGYELEKDKNMRCTVCQDLSCLYRVLISFLMLYRQQQPDKILMHECMCMCV